MTNVDLVNMHDQNVGFGCVTSKTEGEVATMVAKGTTFVLTVRGTNSRILVTKQVLDNYFLAFVPEPEQEGDENQDGDFDLKP